MLARAVLVGMLAAAVAAPSDPSIVQLDSGAIRGVVGTKSRSFLGIPFAAPPVGPLRWQAPQAPQAWSGVLNTTWYASSCSQGSNMFTLMAPISEDCLYLNVYTPFPAPTQPLPIMIFFYGGGWDTGSASTLFYDADSDISLVEDVIMVTANYRLNVFGFLASSALRAQDADGSTGNYGLQDQRFSMEWVKRNGAAFGGDTSRVTIWGESAGAGSVSCHMVSPRSQGLFHRAISESGPIADWTAEPYNTSVAKYVDVARYLGCCSQFCIDEDPAILACLRQQNTSALESAGNAWNLGKGFLRWSPVIDGVDIPDDPRVLAAAGKVANVPVLYGSNQDEGTGFTSCPNDLPSTQYASYLNETYGADIGGAILEEYPVTNYKSAFWASSHALGDAEMSCPARNTARWLTSARANATNPAPVYVYFFNHTLTFIDIFAPNYGCFHGSELFFVFDLTLGLWTPGEQALAKAFVKYWTSFAATGVPSFPGLPEWPPFTQDSQMYGMLNTDTLLTPVANLKQGFCDFWDQHPVPIDLIWGM